MGKNTSILSISIRKDLKTRLDDYRLSCKERSLSKMICNMVESSMASDEFKTQIKHAEHASKEIYYKWYDSLFLYKFREIFRSGLTWIELPVFCFSSSEVGISEEEAVTNELQILYHNILEQCRTLGLIGIDITNIIKIIKKSKKIKILAVRIMQKGSADADSGVSYIYAVAIINVENNINGNHHYYFDYNSIRCFDVSLLYNNSLSELLKREIGIPIGYLYWIPVTIFQDKVLVLGVKQRKLAKIDIDNIKKNKIIIVKP